jgi:hypothetical protein
MRARVLSVGILTAVIGVGSGAMGMPPAAAQGDPVGGVGNTYWIGGAGNTSGRAVQWFGYGDVRDEVYFGDFIDRTGAFGGDGSDDAMVRRGNIFIIRGQCGRTFTYGDPGDTVLVGDWDGDGTDTLAVRRGNRFFVKNDIDTGAADYTFEYGDPGDTVLVGNWDGDFIFGEPDRDLTDTMMIRRGNRFFVKNDTTTGVADYEFVFGDPGDTLLVGDWAVPPLYGDDPATPIPNDYAVQRGDHSDGADQLAVRRGNVYHQSDEIWLAEETPAVNPGTVRAFAYGNPGDTAFVAAEQYTYRTTDGFHTISGDGLAVRRPAGQFQGPPRPAPC